MGRGVLAIAALFILAGIPEPKADAQQSNPNASTPQTAAVQPRDYYRPCDEQDVNRNSDLCAQWKAADWAKRSFWIGLAGVAGLVLTLWFNLEAWRKARKGESDTKAALKAAQDNAAAATKLADTAEKTARAELRAYLDFDGVCLVRLPQRDKEGAPELAVKASARIRNFGKTPAENMQITTTNYVKAKGPRHQFTVEDKIDFDYVAPADYVTHQAFWDMPKTIWEAVEQRKITLIVSLIVTYTDVFKTPHVLRSDFETFDVAEELGFVRGTRKAT